MTDDQALEILLLGVYLTTHIFCLRQRMQSDKQRRQLLSEEGLNLPYPLKVSSHLYLCRSLLLFEGLSLYLIMFLGSTLITQEFHEYILSKDKKYYDTYRILTYYLELLLHLLIDLVLYQVISSFKKVQEQSKFILVILLQFVLFVLNMERVQKYEYFQKVHVVYLLNNAVMLYSVMKMLVISQDLQKARKLTQSIKDISLQNLYDNFSKQLSSLNKEELIANNQKILTTYHFMLQIRKIRLNYKQLLEKGLRVLFWFCLPLLFLSTYLVLAETEVLLKGQPSYFNQEDLAILKQKNIYEDYYLLNQLRPVHQLNTTRPSVVFFLVDGLNQEHFRSHPKLTKLLQEIKKDKNGQLFKLQSQTPSVPLNNWYSMFTGIDSSVHGIWRQTRKQKFHNYDNVFSHVQENKDLLDHYLLGDEFFQNTLLNAFPQLTYLKPKGPEDFSDEKIFQRFTKYMKSTAKANNSTNYLRNVQLLETLRQGKEGGPSYSELQKVFDFLEDQSQLENIQQKHALYVVQQTQGDMDSVINRILSVYQQSDKNTVILVGSDNGAEWGASDSLSTELPLLFLFKTNQVVQTVPPAKPYSTKDLASTLSMLLGLPVPRNNQGVPIMGIVDAVLDQPTQNTFAKNDLKIQQQTLQQYLHKKQWEENKKYDEWVMLLLGNLLLAYGVLAVVVAYRFTNTKMPFTSCPERRVNIWLFFQGIYLLAVCFIIAMVILLLLYSLVLPVSSWDASLMNNSWRLSFMCVFALGVIQLMGLVLGKSVYLSMGRVKGISMVLKVLQGDLEVFQRQEEVMQESLLKESVGVCNDTIYRIVTLKVYMVLICHLDQVGLILLSQFYLSYQPHIDQNYSMRFLLMVLMLLNGVFLAHLLFSLSQLPTISVNNNLYDDYYLTVFIDPTSKNSGEETEFLNCAFARFDISDMNKLILGDQSNAGAQDQDGESDNLLQKNK